MSVTLQDYRTERQTDEPTTDDEPEMCEHDVRTLDEDPFTCFKCWMLEQGSDLSFTPERETA